MFAQTMMNRTTDRTTGYLWAPGERPIEGYEIVRGLGLGGFGEVYLAVNNAGKEVAIKRIRRNAAIEIRGAQQCLNLRHPHLVQLLDLRQVDDQEAWIVMEYVPGETLRDKIDRGGMTLAEVATLGGQLASAVAYLHGQGIVHRDLKPANVFIDGGLIKLGDYGLSKIIASTARDGHTSSIGTCHYMAPEISRGVYGSQIDTYALGVILYEMATGRVPFDGESPEEIIVKHLTDAADLNGVADPLANIIARCLAKDPAERYRDVGELAGELAGIAGQARFGSSNDRVRDAQAAKRGVGGAALGAAALGDATGPAAGEELLFDPIGTPRAAADAARRAFPWDEPIAAAVIKAGTDFFHWWRSLRSRVLQIIVLVGMTLLLARTSHLWLPVIRLSLIFYPMYFGIRYWKRSQASSTPPPARTLSPAKTMSYVAPTAAAAPNPRAGEPRAEGAAVPVKMSLKQWQAFHRQRLAGQPAALRLADYFGSLFKASLVVAIFAIVGSLAAVAATPLPPREIASTMLWSAAVTLFSTAIILGLANLWQSQQEDGVTYRFVQMSCGLLVGGLAFVLDRYLHVPWAELVNALELGGQIDVPERMVRFHQTAALHEGFYEGLRPLLPAYLAYFTSVFAIVRWYRAADRLRKSRVSLSGVFGAAILTGIIVSFVYMPAAVAIGLSVALALTLNLSSPWIRREFA